MMIDGAGWQGRQGRRGEAWQERARVVGLLQQVYTSGVPTVRGDDTGTASELMLLLFWLLDSGTVVL